MNKKMRITIIGLTAVILIIMIALGGTIINRLTPSKEVMLLTDYYKVDEGEVLLILQDKIYEKNGLLIDGTIYIDYDTIKTRFNQRFYWDYSENILTYTTPNEILQVEAGNNSYSIVKSMIKTNASIEYPIVKVFADEVYIALDFVERYSDITVQFYEEPNRAIINYQWGESLFTEATKDTQLRYEADIKSPILVQIPSSTELKYMSIEEAPRKGFIKVRTEDGIIGYVKEKHTKQSYYKKIDSVFQEPQYTAQTRSDKINLVFHQIFNKDAVNYLEGLIGATKGVNVVSPTWFSINDVTGTVSSFASQEYMEKAKGLGLEVWALVDDVNNDIDMLELLSHTSYRENLSNTLIEAALEYKLNGINIDFEKISSDAGEHYIQFLREFSVKCRNNGIVLSVDNYVPSAYTKHYNREEQGIIVDYVIVMAYDEHYAGSDVAGPVSSLGFVKDAVTNILTMVPKEKTIIAIPFYTRLWKETEEGDVTADSYAMTPAANILEENGAQTQWNDILGCYYAEYEKDGAVYRMWQEEDRSIESKVEVIYEAEVAGIAAWKLGLEKESIWNVIIRYLD